jgi:hypothetical protein
MKSIHMNRMGKVTSNEAVDTVPNGNYPYIQDGTEHSLLYRKWSNSNK